MKALMFFSLLLLGRGAAAESVEILTAACDFSLKQQKLPWACYYPAIKLQPRWSRSRLDRQCIKMAKIAENVALVNQDRLKFLPLHCLKQAQQTLKVIEYKEEDI